MDLTDLPALLPLFRELVRQALPPTSDLSPSLPEVLQARDEPVTPHLVREVLQSPDLRALIRAVFQEEMKLQHLAMTPRRSPEVLQASVQVRSGSRGPRPAKLETSKEGRKLDAYLAGKLEVLPANVVALFETPGVTKKRSEMLVGKLLKARGWTKDLVTRDGRRVRCWRSPEYNKATQLHTDALLRCQEQVDQQQAFASVLKESGKHKLLAIDAAKFLPPAACAPAAGCATFTRRAAQRRAANFLRALGWTPVRHQRKGLAITCWYAPGHAPEFGSDDSDDPRVVALRDSTGGSAERGAVHEDVDDEDEFARHDPNDATRH